MDVSSDRFATDVLEASHTVPVLVDFWAPWCGPCRVLGPVLEKLHTEAAGRWRLAKVNTDEAPELAQTWDIRGIPAVKLFRNGRVAAEFVGALPESAVRSWLSDHVPDETRMRLDAAKAALTAADRSAARTLLEQIVKDQPTHAEARVLLAEVLLPDVPERARQLVDDTRDDGSFTDRIAGVQLLAELLTRKIETPSGDGAAAHWHAGVRALQAHNWQQAALDWIEVVKRDRKLEEDGARRASVALFRWLGDDHPVTRELRPRFASALY